MPSWGDRLGIPPPNEAVPDPRAPGAGAAIEEAAALGMDALARLVVAADRPKAAMGG